MRSELVGTLARKRRNEKCSQNLFRNTEQQDHMKNKTTNIYV